MESAWPLQVRRLILPLSGDVIYMPEAMNVNFPLPLVKDTLGRADVQTGKLDKAVGTYERLTAPLPNKQRPGSSIL